MREMPRSDRDISVYLSFLLRHHPEAAALDMDRHGWVGTAQLLANIQETCPLTVEHLERIVAEDNKGRYRFNADKTRIKACQGHSIPWVEPELTYGPPPAILYHGTTQAAWEKIQSTGYISKMARHAVHMQADVEKAWQSARRWRQEAVVLQIDAERMQRDGVVFGVSDNGVWCAEQVDTDYIAKVLR